MAAEEGKVDPMHQFTIEPVGSWAHWEIAGVDVTFTNSALWMMITTILAIATGSRSIPGGGGNCLQFEVVTAKAAHKYFLATWQHFQRTIKAPEVPCRVAIVAA